MAVAYLRFLTRHDTYAFQWSLHVCKKPNGEGKSKSGWEDADGACISVIERRRALKLGES